MKTYPKLSVALMLPVLLFCTTVWHSPAHAVPESDAVKASKASDKLDVDLIKDIETEKDLFEYKIEGRPDPFIPFITEKAATARMEEVLPVEQQLTGMQVFEPGQLNLVAIIMAENNEFAMAEDFTGKGYILRPGMLIGKRGVITAIESNQVIIEETAFTRAGKKLTSKIVMLLKKEGEE